MTKVKPLGGEVLLRSMKAEAKTKSGLFTGKDTDVVLQNIFTVAEVGPYATVNVGDIVVLKSGAGQRYMDPKQIGDLDAEVLLLAGSQHILAVLEY